LRFGVNDPDQRNARIEEILDLSIQLVDRVIRRGHLDDEVRSDSRVTFGRLSRRESFLLGERDVGNPDLVGIAGKDLITSLRSVDPTKFVRPGKVDQKVTDQ